MSGVARVLRHVKRILRTRSHLKKACSLAHQDMHMKVGSFRHAGRCSSATDIRVEVHNHTQMLRRKHSSAMCGTSHVKIGNVVHYMLCLCALCVWVSHVAPVTRQYSLIAIARASNKQYNATLQSRAIKCRAAAVAQRACRTTHTYTRQAHSSVTLCSPSPHTLLEAL
jgi:hypothetical protein